LLPGNGQIFMFSHVDLMVQKVRKATLGVEVLQKMASGGVDDFLERNRLKKIGFRVVDTKPENACVAYLPETQARAFRVATT